MLYLVVGDVALRSPAATVQNLNTLLADARFLPHVRETGLAFAQGFAIAVVVGLLIGVPLGAARFAGEVAEPILVALYSIPKVTLYPVILLIFGIGMPAKVAFGAIHGIVPISIFAHERGAQHQSHAPAHGAHASPFSEQFDLRTSCCRRRCRRSSPASASAFRWR